MADDNTAAADKMRSEGLRAWFGKSEALKGITLPLAAKRAAISVLASSIVTVSGPTPPGTGVMWLATSRTFA